MELEVVEAVFLLEKAVMVERCGAHINRHNPRSWVGISENCSLIAAAAGDQNVEISAIVVIWSEQAMRVAGIKPLPVGGQPSGQSLDEFWVDPGFVLPGYNIRKWIRHLHYWPIFRP